MAKATNPVTISQHFKVSPARLLELGVLDGTMAMDTRLFIDPLLLEQSDQPEMKNAAVNYRKHFEKVISLLAGSQRENDAAWRGALRLLEFHEVPATCLGYGVASDDGSGFGPELTDTLIRTGKEIVDLGIKDTDLFSLLALFEERIGADRISDMTTNVIIADLIKFNERILAELKLPARQQNLKIAEAVLAVNPYTKKPSPILFVPNDILRPLPVAVDRSEICEAASKNRLLRFRVNAHISGIWTLKTRRDKENFKKQILADAKAFQTLLEAYKSVEAKAYSAIDDSEGYLSWSHDAYAAVQKAPISLNLGSPKDAAKVVGAIVEQFKFLIEDRGLWKNLFKGGYALNEHYSQGLFFAAAYSYCKANNLDISPEVDTGSGRVDFKFSSGFSERVLVEIKLSKNPNLVSGYTKQIQRYNQAEECLGGFYIVIDVGGMGKRDDELMKAKAEMSKQKKNSQQ